MPKLPSDNDNNLIEPDEVQKKILDGLVQQGNYKLAREMCRASNLRYDFGIEETEKYLLQFRTTCPAMNKLKDKCRILANKPDPVLITGPTGTGKELLAKSLHGNRSGKFIAVNCAALPEELLESELFGHVAGAFTGAIRDKIGMFSHAKNGTIFLDEIGEMSWQAQAALLRTLQESVIRKIGSNDDEAINARIICATWHNLTEECIAGKFRLDLYYRLSRVTLHTTPLRSRIDDIDLIVSHLDETGVITDNGLKHIKEYFMSNGDGNVREIENIIRRVQLFGEGEMGI